MYRALLRPGWRLGTNSLSGRRGRTALLCSAVSLAAALVAAVATCMESVQAALAERLAAALGAADARIVHLFNGRFDESLLDRAAAWPEVDTAIGRFSAALTLVRSDERIDPETGIPLRTTVRAHGIEPPLEFDVRPVDLVAGRYPAQENETLIDSIVASDLEVGVGDELVVQRFGEPVVLKVVGVYSRPILGALQTPQIQMLRPMLEEAAEREGSLSDIAIMLKEGVEVQPFCDRHIHELPDELSLEPAEMARTGFDNRLRASRIMFIIGSFFVFLCASFIIVIGMTTGVAERQRELAITRCIGASRGQVFLSQMWVGLIIGTIGAVTGIPIGIGLASLLVWYFGDLLPMGVVVGGLGIALAGAGSILAGLAGALWPAVAASRVSPLQAVVVRANPPRAKNIIRLGVIGLAGIVTQILLFSIEDRDVRFWLYVTVGLLAMTVGYFLIAAPIFAGAASALSAPLSRIFRLPAGLLKQSALSIPVRLGLTAGALMVGLAILVNSWASTTALLEDWLGKMTFADGFALNRSGISRNARDRIASLDFVEAVCPIGYLPLQVMDRQVFGVKGLAPPNVICIGFQPDLFFKVNRIQWIEGTPEDAIPKLKRGEGILVASEFLTARGMKVGDVLELGAGRISRKYEIVGVVGAAGLDVATQLFGIRNVYNESALSCVFADFDAMAEQYDNPDVYVLQLNLSREIEDREATAIIAEEAPGTLFISGRGIKEIINQLGSAALAVETTVAFAALILASIAVGNVLVANVNSRKFEYGILRAVGASKGHLVRLVFGEAVLLAITAAIVGTIFGLHASWIDIILHRELAGIVMHMNFPAAATTIGWLCLLALTLLAAVPAARGLVRSSPRALLAIGRGGA